MDKQRDEADANAAFWARIHASYGPVNDLLDNMLADAEREPPVRRGPAGQVAVNRRPVAGDDGATENGERWDGLY